MYVHVEGKFIPTHIRFATKTQPFHFVMMRFS